MADNTQAELAKMEQGVPTFAFLPTKLQDNTWIWFRRYVKVYYMGRRDNGDLFVWSGARDTYMPIFKRFRTSEDVLAQKLKGTLWQNSH